MDWTMVIQTKYSTSIFRLENSEMFRCSSGQAKRSRDTCRTRSSTCACIRSYNHAHMNAWDGETIHDFADIDPNPAPVLGRPCFPARLWRHDPAHMGGSQRPVPHTHRWRYHETLPAPPRALRPRDLVF